MKKYSNLKSVMETGDHFKNGASPKSQMIRGKFKTKTIFAILLLFWACSFVYAQDDRFYEKEYTTYDSAFEALKAHSKNKGFKAVENKYKACKNLEGATIKNIDEGLNEFTGRMEVHITWDYKYSGCYWGIHKYNGSAKVKSSISKTEKGYFKISERGVDVLSWDPEK